MIYLPLSQAAAVGGRLEFNGHPLVFGAQIAQFVDSIQSSTRTGRSINKISDDFIDPVKEWISGQATQFLERLG